jgi:hypothetical protein
VHFYSDRKRYKSERYEEGGREMKGKIDRRWNMWQREGR